MVSALFRRDRGRAGDADEVEELDDVETTDDELGPEEDEEELPGLSPRPDGPWDVSERPDDEGLIDLGALRVHGRDGMELRLEVDEVPGSFGRELIARIPVRTPDGRSGHQPARFVGVDGPRWFLRAVFHGPAVYEDEAAAAMEAVVKDVVVVRGPDAMAPRDLLPLRLPDAVATPEPDAETDGREPLEPFRRGPEITEIR